MIFAHILMANADSRVEENVNRLTILNLTTIFVSDKAKMVFQKGLQLKLSVKNLRSYLARVLGLR